MQALKKQLIAVVDKIHLKAIQDRVTKYTNVTLFTMLQHLYDTYGKITEDKLEENRQEMTKAYDISLPIETLYARIEDCVDFADAARSPYSQAQILNTAFLLIQKTGVFNKECRKWRKQLAANKTWDNFKIFFKEAYDDYKEDTEMTASGLGFNATDETEVYNATANLTTHNALEHLAAATAADQTAVANLTHANVKLSQELQTSNTSYQTLKKSMEKLQAQLTALQSQSAPTHQQVPVFPQQNFMPQPQSFPSAPFYSAPSRGRGRQGRGSGRG